ncbi:MAG: SUMF1/EgtB/PvdO family nonheme iron enzyme [Bacteroidales bacterium]|nr:SUMF1/EgtB/PvdO family nonheme iron enzyme [Bacteroidales bacterium]
MKKITIFSLLPCFLCMAFAFGHGKEMQQWTNPKDGMVFIQVPAGRLTVQQGDTLGTPNEKLPYLEKVFDQPFLMGRTEVTIRQFRSFVEETGFITDAEKAGNRYNWKNPGYNQDEDHPVVYVSFKDAKAYAIWAGVDLPDEAEWLYACCAGTMTKYYWGDKMQPDLFWHRENSTAGTHPVATKQPNPWGFYDMIGNAQEYCSLNDGGFSGRGESFARCISYISAYNDAILDFVVARSVSRILNVWKIARQGDIYYSDDDIGFRCIKREKRNE